MENNTALVTQEVASETQREAQVARQAATQLEGFVVVTPSDIQIASGLLVDFKRELKRVTARKEEITKPLNAALKSIRDLFRPAEEAYSHAEQILKQKISAAQLEIFEANRRAALATQAALAAGDVRQAALVSSAIVSTEAPKGISFREQFTFRIVNAALLPRDFLMPDEPKIRAHVAQHGLGSNIPGVVVEKSIGVAARTAP